MAKSKSSKASKQEIQVSKSPAEFFAENQAIAGFDNMGKSLYTTIRELVENSLDACECVNVLPDIVLQIDEMNQLDFNQLRGVLGSGGGFGAIDEGLFKKKKGGSGGSGSGSIGVTASTIKSAVSGSIVSISNSNGNSNSNSGITASSSSAQKKKKGGRNEDAYFRITVRDNGCGMVHDAIPNLLGRVLSGSKYGVRQTRGKFGLGAK
jgi:signal transduction histidine kinase